MKLCCGICLWESQCLDSEWVLSFLLLIGNSNGNGGFRCLFGTVCGGPIQSKSKRTTVWLWLWGSPIYIYFLIYNITNCVFYYDGAFLALHVKFRYLVSSLVLRDWGSPIYIYIFLIYNITDCVFYCDGAFLALHVKFRYLVSSLVLRDCLYPISLFGLLTDDVKILY